MPAWHKLRSLTYLLNPLYISVFFSLQTISELEDQLSSLRDELQGAITQHKQKLAELALLREEEKQRALLDKKSALDRQRTEMEHIRSDLERSHLQAKDAAQEKVSEGSVKDDMWSVSNRKKLFYWRKLG